jgi:ribonuclease HII
MGTQYCIGADENGLGPRLGPMIVTAVLAKVEPEAARVVTSKPRGGLAKRLGDSKGLVAHGNVGLGEAWTRVLVRRGAGRHVAEAVGPDQLVDAVCLDAREELTAPCPDHVKPQCWDTEAEVFGDAEEVAPLMQLVGKDLDRLAQRGVSVMAVRSVVVCTKRLNEACERGHSRFVVDLHAMERLVLVMREMAGAEVSAVCGKVGGFGEYSKVFGPLGGRLHAILEEGRARSAYRFPGIGEIAFVRDGDATNILVGMASIVGKYLREILMERIVRHYRSRDPELPVVSGYHDPVTSDFIVATSSLRRKSRVPRDCFERDRVTPIEGPGSARSARKGAAPAS